MDFNDPPDSFVLAIILVLIAITIAITIILCHSYVTESPTTVSQARQQFYEWHAHYQDTRDMLYSDYAHKN